MGGRVRQLLRNAAQSRSNALSRKVAMCCSTSTGKVHAKLRETEAKDDVVAVFILPPSAMALEERLNVRAEDAPEDRPSADRECEQRNPALGRIRLRHRQRGRRAFVAAALPSLAAERLRRSRQIGLKDFVQGLLAELKCSGDQRPRPLASLAKSATSSSSARAVGAMPSESSRASASGHDLPKRGAQHLAPLAEGGGGDPSRAPQYRKEVRARPSAPVPRDWSRPSAPA